MSYLIFIVLFIIGSVLGSFLGCMGYRIPNKIKTTYPPSFCENCHEKLKWYMNIPIFSYIYLKGKCKFCKKPIGKIYFVSELLCGLLFCINYLIFGFSMNFFISIILTCMLIVTIVSDIKYYYISDRVIIIGLICAVIVSLAFESNDFTLRYIISGVILFIIMYLIKVIGNLVFKKESLGDGDIKLMGVIGVCVGLINGFLSLFIGSLLGLIYSLFIKKKNILPFGPFLLFGAHISLYVSNYFIYIIDQIL